VTGEKNLSPDVPLPQGIAGVMSVFNFHTPRTYTAVYLAYA